MLRFLRSFFLEKQTSGAFIGLERDLEVGAFLRPSMAETWAGPFLGRGFLGGLGRCLFFWKEFGLKFLDVFWSFFDLF